jgi:radical SAM protein with 4Fe4S-binding SPASM domain
MERYYPAIDWVDDYLKNLGPYIYVREEDHLLIKIPNEAYKLNTAGVSILKRMLKGERARDIVDAYPEREKVAEDIHVFFSDLRALLKGCYQEMDERRAVIKVPFTLGFNTLPVLSEIAVTYRCNLACRFCYAGCGCRKDDDSAELSTGQVMEILRIIREEAEVPSVSFTGGEPTIRKDLPALIRHAKQLGMWTNLITNGTMITESRAAEFRSAGLDSAQVSLEAGNADLHDRIVQRTGAFHQGLSGLRNLKEAGIRVHTNTTISGLNRDGLPEILDLVKAQGMDKFSMNMIMPQGSALTALNDLQIRYSEVGDLVLGVQRRAMELGLEFMWYSPTPICIFNPVVHGLGNKGCAACDGLLSIAPNGDILPCSSYPRPVGNLLEMAGNFRKAWRQGEFAFYQRKGFAQDRCQACEYLAVCNGGCPLYWDAVGIDELQFRRWPLEDLP